MPNQTDKKNRMEQFCALLRRHGMKATPQRIAVHEVMLRLGHASADMVAESIAESSEVKVTVASVYNILTQFAVLGIYGRRMSSNNKMYFDVNSFRHIHLYDRENHAYKDVMDEELLRIIEEHFSGRRFRGYRLEDIDIQLVVRPTRRKLRTY